MIDDSGLRCLGAAILLQAVTELHGGPTADTPREGRGQRRRDALVYLQPDDPDLTFWCDVLDLDATDFCEAARRNGRELRRIAERAG